MDLTSLKGAAVLYKLVSKLIGKVYQTLMPRIANSLHSYDKHYRERHGIIKVSCAEMREPILLDDIYVAVRFLGRRGRVKYSSPTDIEKAFREWRNRRPVSSLAEEMLTPDERQDGMQIANDKQYLMVLGGPGIGKSTFLRKVGLEALKKKEAKFKHKCTPVFLELKRCTDDLIDIEALIADEFKTCGYPRPEQRAKTTLKSGKLLILLDGLDEVPAMNVDNVICKIEDFVDRYNQNRFIVSCRMAARTRRLKQFTDVEIAEFDDSQIKAYIDNWFASTPELQQRQPNEKMKTAEQCWQALNEHCFEATKELARNPLLLAFLCMAYNDLGNFPENRVDLYEKVLNIIIKEWEAEKGAPRDSSVNQYLNILTEKRLLYEIAMKNFEMDRLFFSESELVDHIQEFGERSANIPPIFDASKILETIVVEQGLLVERGSGVYSFFHLTFHEYLTANYIVENTGSIHALVTQYLHDERWREVFLLTAELMPEADDFLMKMKTEVSKSINTPRLKALFQWAKRITNTLDDRYDGAAIRAFAIRQYISIWLLGKIYEMVKDIVNYSLDYNSAFYQNLDIYRKLYLRLRVNLRCYLYFNPDFPEYFYFDPRFYEGYVSDRDLHQDLDLYQDYNLEMYHYLETYRYLNIHHFLEDDLYADFYQYMDTDCYSLVDSKFGDRFDRELHGRITLVEQMDELEIFKGIDFQRMIQVLNEHREFINAARKGESNKPLEESIHDAWISVLGITDDLLAITSQEMTNYDQYLYTVELIAACKEVTSHVTPEIWKQIENQLLTWDVEDIED